MKQIEWNDIYTFDRKKQRELLMSLEDWQAEKLHGLIDMARLLGYSVREWPESKNKGGLLVEFDFKNSDRTYCLCLVFDDKKFLLRKTKIWDYKTGNELFSSRDFLSIDRLVEIL